DEDIGVRGIDDGAPAPGMLVLVLGEAGVSGFVIDREVDLREIDGMDIEPPVLARETLEPAADADAHPAGARAGDDDVEAKRHCNIPSGAERVTSSFRCRARGPHPPATARDYPCRLREVNRAHSRAARLSFPPALRIYGNRMPEPAWTDMADTRTDPAPITLLLAAPRGFCAGV